MSTQLVLTVRAVYEGDFTVTPIVRPLIIVDYAEFEALELPVAVSRKLITRYPHVKLERGTVALAYHKFNGHIPAQCGPCHFVCESEIAEEPIRLVYCPEPEVYFPDFHQAVTYGRHLKHQLFFLGEELVYSNQLEGKSTVGVQHIARCYDSSKTLFKAIAKGDLPDQVVHVARLVHAGVRGAQPSKQQRASSSAEMDESTSQHYQLQINALSERIAHLEGVMSVLHLLAGTSGLNCDGLDSGALNCDGFDSDTHPLNTDAPEYGASSSDPHT